MISGLPVRSMTVQERRSRQMAAFDELPPEVRAAIGRASFDLLPSDVALSLKRYNPSTVIRWIEDAAQRRQSIYETSISEQRNLPPAERPPC